MHVFDEPDGVDEYEAEIIATIVLVDSSRERG